MNDYVMYPAGDLDRAAVLDRSPAGQGGFMDFRHTERTQQTRPAPPPINLDAGRLDIARAGLAGGFVLISLLVAILGIGIVYYVEVFIIDLLGAGIAGVAISLGSVVLYISITEWIDHRTRVKEWHDAAIDTYIEQSGLERVEQVSEWELSSNNPGHVLLVALWVHMRLQEGENNAFTVRKLNSPLFLGGRRVGNLSKLGAETMGQKLAQLGLIDGRREGFSGEWTPASADQVLEMVVNNWR